MRKKLNLNFLPKIIELNLDNIPDNAVFIGVAGFEDRSLAFLSECKLLTKKFQKIFGIKYLPVQENNLIEDFTKLAKKSSIEKTIEWVTYNRFDPESFYETLNEKIEEIICTGNIVIDISGMSKFLIIILLTELAKKPVTVDIIYSEAEIYHPIKDVYENHLENFQKNITPFFLTTNVYRIVTTPQLSSNSMQGAPLLIIAFPTFNYRDFFTLLNTLTPQYLIEIEGKPHNKKDNWRQEAIHKINERLAKDFQPNIEQIFCKSVSTFEYIETIKMLSECYLTEEYQYTHKCIIAPTGSKLQTLGVFFFKQIYPDIHLVYPVTEHFLKDYTNGWKKIWHIKVENFPKIISALKKNRKSGLDQIAKKISENQSD
ncbi:MAG: hypothetical protein WC379_06810 [Methanoregula sp.]|jgi:hypothetical protein